MSEVSIVPSTPVASPMEARPAAHLPPKQITPVAAPDASRAMTLFVMIVATLYFGKTVLVPVTLALLLAFILAPLVSLLRKAHLPRVPAVLLGVILAVSIILAIGGVIGAQISDLSTHMPEYAATIESKVDSVRSFTIGRVAALANHIGVKNNTAGSLRAPARTSGAGALQDLRGSVDLSSPGVMPLELAQRILSPVLSPIASFGIVLLVAIFALLQQEDLRDRLIRLLGSNDLHRTTLAIDDGARRLSRYFLSQLSVNSLFGVVIGIGLLAIGIPNPVLFGILSALLRFVPYVGSLISALLPLSLAAAVGPDWSMTAQVAILYLTVEGVTGQVVEPMTYGHSTGLSPFSVVVAAIFWSWLWGPVGLILSTPLTLCLVVMGRHVKRLEFLDVMLGNRPALTPVESFYQRILAGDADEAQDQAELLLKERSLAIYYDDVAIKGLQMAATDAQRGVLSYDQLQRVQSTIKGLVDGLSAHQDKIESDMPAAPPVGTGASVMCVSGRGPLDEAASMILAQLLTRQGMQTRLVAYHDVSREHVSALDIAGVTTVCISCLDIAGSPAHLRYLVRRLRQRLPADTPIIIGMWPPEDPMIVDPQLSASMGADYCNSSIDQAVAFCVKAARSSGSATLAASASSGGGTQL